MTKNHVIKFEGLGPCFYEIVGFRPPQAKEYYLSGSIVTAYKAYQTLGAPYYVVRPTNKAIPVQRYERGASLCEQV